MSLTKRFTGDYSITSTNSGNVNITGQSLNVFGNLNVVGTTTQSFVTNSAVNTNFLTLNDNHTGAPYLNAGIIVNRGTGANVELIYNETINQWQISNDGSTFGNIAVNFASTPFLNNVAGDSSPTLNGNLNVQSYQIYSNSSPVVTFTTNVAISQTAVAPGATSGNTVVYAQTPGNGNAGLYVTNSSQTQQQQELITKNKAIAYALFM
jgi:hypothetical protein